MYLVYTRNMKRTDTHRPSAINPAEYEYVALELIPIGRYTGDIMSDCAIIQAERIRIRAHMERTGGTYSRHEHGGNCMVCGSPNAIYTILFYHALTNTYVRMGTDCAEKCEMAVYGDIDAFKKGIDRAMEHKAGKAKAQAVLASLNLSAAWELYVSETRVSEYEETTIIDMVGKLVTYGSLSERQINFMHSLFGKIATREERKAAEQAAYDAAVEFPNIDGRIAFDGTVLGFRHTDSVYGPVTKMLIQSVDGWKAWGTLPLAICNVEKGAHITFVARFSPSTDDPKFGFFSRPTKAEVHEEVLA